MVTAATSTTPGRCRQRDSRQAAGSARRSLGCGSGRRARLVGRRQRFVGQALLVEHLGRLVERARFADGHPARARDRCRSGRSPASSSGGEQGAAPGPPPIRRPRMRLLGGRGRRFGRRRGIGGGCLGRVAGRLRRLGRVRRPRPRPRRPRSASAAGSGTSAIASSAGISTLSAIASSEASPESPQAASARANEETAANRANFFIGRGLSIDVRSGRSPPARRI